MKAQQKIVFIIQPKADYWKKQTVVNAIHKYVEKEQSIPEIVLHCMPDMERRYPREWRKR